MKYIKYIQYLLFAISIVLIVVFYATPVSYTHLDVYKRQAMIQGIPIETVATITTNNARKLFSL